MCIGICFLRDFLIDLEDIVLKGSFKNINFKEKITSLSLWPLINEQLTQIDAVYCDMFNIT